MSSFVDYENEFHSHCEIELQIARTIVNTHGNEVMIFRQNYMLRKTDPRPCQTKGITSAPTL